MYCKKCGSKLPENAQFCTNCGAKVDDSADKKSAQKTPKTNESIKNKLPKKMSKKAWIIVAVAAVVLICGGFLYNYLTNPKGVWLGDSNADVLDIESDGTGYFNEYGFTNINAAITWKKTGFNKIQIKYTDDGEQSIFDAKLKDGKLVTPDGENWNAETFKKTHKPESEAKADVQKYINPSMKSLIDSPTQHIWLDVFDVDGNPDDLKPSATVSNIYVTQNGKSTFYKIDPDQEPTLAKISKMSNDEIINYAKNHLWSKYNHGKPSHDKPTKDFSNDGHFESHGQQIGNYFFTGYALTTNILGKETSFHLVRLSIPNKNADIPCLQ